MWNRLKSLWSGTFPEIEEEGETPAPQGRVPTAKANARALALEAVDEALAQGNSAIALNRLRQLLVEGAPDREELKRGGSVMRAVGELELATLFEAAAERSSSEPAARLAAAFLEMDDAPVARALAAVAHQRSQGTEPVVARIYADATARQGDHAAVVELLARWEGKWPSPALLGRYALSAVLSGRGEVWERVRPQVIANPNLVWMAGAAGRMGLADGDAPLRRAVFLEYGSVLLDASAVQGRGNLGPGRLARAMQRARDVLKGADIAVDRVCYVSRRGEVFAQWMARLLDATAIPLTSRIQDQRVLAVAADGDDLDLVMAHPALDHGPTSLFQVLKSPTRTGSVVPELIGLLSDGATLPLGALEAPAAADRVPPRLHFAELLRVSETTPAGPEAGDIWEKPAAWAQKLRPHLLVSLVRAGKDRPDWLGDLPEWAFIAPVPPPKPAPVVVVDELADEDLEDDDEYEDDEDGADDDEV
ncbi:MAG: hypothetical protein R3F39_24505 [Myxococcota bacterium]